MSGPLHDQLGFAPDYNSPVPYSGLRVGGDSALNFFVDAIVRNAPINDAT